MSFFDFMAKTVPPAEPGNLLWLACDVSSLLGQLLKLPRNSPEWHAKANEVLWHRMALAESEPKTTLDLLMLAFTARQAVWMLTTPDLHPDCREYWAREAASALIRIQWRLEIRCGVTTDQLDLDFAGVPGRREK